MRYEHGEADFSPKASRGRFCPAKCRKAAWQRQRKDNPALVGEQFTRVLARVRTLQASKAA